MKESTAKRKEERRNTRNQNKVNRKQARVNKKTEKKTAVQEGRSQRQQARLKKKEDLGGGVFQRARQRVFGVSPVNRAARRKNIKERITNRGPQTSEESGK